MDAQQVFYTLSLLVCCLTLAVCSDTSDRNCSNENSYLWKVDTEPPIYLFGTIHVPYNKLWNHIPENVKTAFSSCHEFCLELRLSDEQTQKELAKCQNLPGDSTVDDVLSRKMIDRIENYLESIKKVFPKWLNAGSPFFGGSDYSDNLFNAIIRDWKKKRPVWILLMISSITEEQVQARNVPLLDLFLDNVAEGLGKQVEAVETPREHCRPLNKISTQKVELALRVQLDYLEVQLARNTLNTGQESSIHTYRCGNFAKLVSTTPLLPLPPLENITATSPTLLPNETALLLETEQYLWKQMVVRRNRKIARSIHGMLKTTRSNILFIALGAGHYLSSNSVIDRLRKKGYTVEHIPADSSIDGPTLPSNAIQLGDPNVRVMPVSMASPTPYHNHNLPTLSPETLENIWSRHLRTYSTPNFVSPIPLTTTTNSPTDQNGNHLSVRNSPLLSGATRDLSSTPDNSHSDTADPHSNTQAPPVDMWSDEVMELFLYQEQPTGSGSGSLSNSYLTCLLSIVLASLSLIHCM